MLLAVDTSTAQVGLAIYDGAQVLAEYAWRSNQHHTIELAPAIAELLKRSGLTMENMLALGVALGPGSFTSLRVGLSLVKGLAIRASSSLDRNSYAGHLRRDAARLQTSITGLYPGRAQQTRCRLVQELKKRLAGKGICTGYGYRILDLWDQDALHRRWRIHCGGTSTACEGRSER